MSEIVASITIKVYLVSGREIIHTYPAPSTKRKMEKFVRDMVDDTKALTRGKIRFLSFRNPQVVYNADNVEGIEMSSIGVNQLEALNKALGKVQTKVGFIKD